MLLSRKNALTLTLFTLATGLTAQIHAAGTLVPARYNLDFKIAVSVNPETREFAKKALPACVVAIPGGSASLAFCLIGPSKLIKGDKSISDFDVYAPALVGLALAGATCWLVARILQQEDTPVDAAKSTPSETHA